MADGKWQMPLANGSPVFTGHWPVNSGQSTADGGWQMANATWQTAPRSSLATGHWPLATIQSSAHFPALEVLLLLGGQLVERDAHGLELERGDELVHGLGHLVDLVLELARVLDGPLGRKCLSGEAHVHHAGRVPMSSGQIDQTALAQHVEPMAVLQDVFIHELANTLVDARGKLAQLVEGKLDVEVA